MGVKSLVLFYLCRKLAFDEERDMVVREEKGGRVNKGGLAKFPLPAFSQAVLMHPFLRFLGSNE